VLLSLPLELPLVLPLELPLALPLAMKLATSFRATPTSLLSRSQILEMSPETRSARGSLPMELAKRSTSHPTAASASPQRLRGLRLYPEQRRRLLPSSLSTVQPAAQDATRMPVAVLPSWLK